MPHVQLEFVRRLGDSWLELAICLEIPHHERQRFRPGEQASAIWDWLVLRDGLGELPEALDAAGRSDLAILLRTFDAGPRSDTPTWPSTAGPASSSQVVDRGPDRRRLRNHLLDGPGGVVIVHGPAGVGKTTIVDSVVESLTDSVRVHRHEAISGIPLDVRTLIEDLEDDPGAELRPGESSLARFDAALEALGPGRVVIVIECAESLLYESNGHVVDLDLDEAFELLATEDAHRTSVVLVTRVLPESPQDRPWPRLAAQFPVTGLPRHDFKNLVLYLSRSENRGLAALPAEALDMFWRALAGNARGAELAHAALRLSADYSPRSLIDELAGLQHGEVLRRLADLVVKSLQVPRRRVLEALATFATPMDDTAVTELLDGQVSASQVNAALPALIDLHLVRAAGVNLYRVSSEIEQILNNTKRGRGALLRRAADVLRARRERAPRSVNDLRIHFAELAVLLRDRRFVSAYPLIRTIDESLTAWNSQHLLLEQRRRVRGQLADDYDEMSNKNALGKIYSDRGQFDEAGLAYHQALNHADALNDDGNRTRLRANLAALHWRRNENDDAYNYYDLARSDAQRHDVPSVRLGSLEGLADCLRRWGRYDDAIRRAEEALAGYSVPDYPDDPDERRFARSRTVWLALKLTRWHAELGEVPAATAYLKRAEAIAGDQWLFASCLEARADFLLGQGEVQRALDLATEAAERAVRLDDSVTLVQARTTMCVAHLRHSNPIAARREIEQAGRSRRPPPSLIVLALLALVARQRGDTATATARFDRLLREATRRTDRDQRDFTAWDFQGFALCGRSGSAGAIRRAATAFRTARTLTGPRATPGLVDRLAFLLEQLDETDPQPGRLRPAIDAARSVMDGSG